MSGAVWTEKQLAELKKIYKSKPAFTTDYQLAGLLSRQFRKSPEAVRWQLRQLHRDTAIKQAPKILLLDIETLPMEAYVWGTWRQDIYMDQIIKDWSILGWSAKWLFDDKVMGAVVTPQEARDRTDRSVLLRVWELMNEANIIIWHNGNNFDAKKLNARFFQNGYPKPLYYQSIDTKKIATDTFAFTYNKLDWIAQILGIGRKIETDFQWWVECAHGNKKYLNLMLEYNKMDVHLEEEVYLRLRPWMEKHPNLNVYGVGEKVVGCAVCGNKNLTWQKTWQTELGLYKAFRCEVCGAPGRSTQKAFKVGSAATKS